MLDMGIHEFDLARLLMGAEVVEVQATGSIVQAPRPPRSGTSTPPW